MCKYSIDYSKVTVYDVLKSSYNFRGSFVRATYLLNSSVGKQISQTNQATTDFENLALKTEFAKCEYLQLLLTGGE